MQLKYIINCVWIKYPDTIILIMLNVENKNYKKKKFV